MNTAQALESRIIRRVIDGAAGSSQKRPWALSAARSMRLAERMISVLAATAALFVFGSFAPELLWSAVGAAAIIVLAADV